MEWPARSGKEEKRTMMPEQRRVLELALLGLDAERQRLNSEIKSVEEELSRTSRLLKESKEVDGGVSSHSRRSMSESQKRKISKSMRARWAARRRK